MSWSDVFDWWGNRIATILAKIFARLGDQLNVERALLVETKQARSEANRAAQEQAARETQALVLLGKLVEALTPPPPKPPTLMKIQFQGQEIGMPGTEQEGLLIEADALEFNAEGEQVPAADPTKLVWTVDDATVAQLLTHADDATIPVGAVKAKGLKAGVARLTCTDQGTTPPLVASDDLTVTLDPTATKMTIQFGTAGPAVTVPAP